MQRARTVVKTPLIAAFFASASLLAGCHSANTFSELSPQTCTETTTPIAGVQGAGWYSPMLEQAVKVRGVVTWLDPGRGLFIQEPASDLSSATSDALYVSNPELYEMVTEGALLTVSGTVAELGSERDTMTAITSVTGYRVCEGRVPLPISNVRLPLSPEDKEALEGMNIVMQQSLAVTDAYAFRDGRLRLGLHGILPAPTEVARPGPDARRQAQMNSRNSIRIALHPDDRQPYAVGTVVMSTTGVLGNDGRGARLILREPMASMPKPVYRTRPAGEGEIRVAGINLHNYFNGDGAGGGFPAPRGARSAAEFAAQRARLTALFGEIGPHLVGVMELENDGFGERSAARDVIHDLETAGGVPWAAVFPDDAPIGTDRITVGIFYRPDVLRPNGPAMPLLEPPFGRLSRIPVAQWFVHQPSGEPLLVVVAHFKSKGSCPDGEGPDADLRDGQGCWNGVRVESARRLIAWISRMLDNSVNRNVLILGDLNAYRMEDPARTIVDAGFKDLTASTGLQLEYSYVYRGEAGTLDYAFASPELARWVRSARYLNFNAAYPPGVALEFPWLGSSDHDPVVVDLRFRQASTSD